MRRDTEKEKVILLKILVLLISGCFQKWNNLSTVSISGITVQGDPDIVTEYI